MLRLTAILLGPHPDADRGGRISGGSGHTGKPRGSFVLLVGPDGSGKSTLAMGLIQSLRSDYTRTIHMHWRPGLLPRAGRFVGTKMGDPSEPHAEEPHERLVSLGLLAYNWVDFFLGTWLRILPARAKGGLVVMERGWMDIVVDPRRYHLDVPPRLVRFLGRLLPGPDVAVVLSADVDVLARRTSELPRDELARQMTAWRDVSFSTRTYRLALDVSQGKEQLVQQAVRVISRQKEAAPCPRPRARARDEGAGR